MQWLHASKTIPIVLGATWIGREALFSSGYSNQKKYRNIIYMLPFTERASVTSNLHLTSILSAVGMFSTVDDSQTLINSKIQSLFARLPFFSRFWLGGRHILKTDQSTTLTGIAMFKTKTFLCLKLWQVMQSVVAEVTGDFLALRL